MNNSIGFYNYPSEAYYQSVHWFNHDRRLHPINDTIPIVPDGATFVKKDVNIGSRHLLFISDGIMGATEACDFIKQFSELNKLRFRIRHANESNSKHSFSTRFNCHKRCGSSIRVCVPKENSGNVTEIRMIQSHTEECLNAEQFPRLFKEEDKFTLSIAVLHREPFNFDDTERGRKFNVQKLTLDTVISDNVSIYECTLRTKEESKEFVRRMGQMLQVIFFARYRKEIQGGGLTELWECSQREKGCPAKLRLRHIENNAIARVIVCDGHSHYKGMSKKATENAEQAIDEPFLLAPGVPEIGMYGNICRKVVRKINAMSFAQLYRFANNKGLSADDLRRQQMLSRIRKMKSRKLSRKHICTNHVIQNDYSNQFNETVNQNIETVEETSLDNDDSGDSSLLSVNSLGSCGTLQQQQSSTKPSITSSVLRESGIFSPLKNSLCDLTSSTMLLSSSSAGLLSRWVARARLDLDNNTPVNTSQRHSTTTTTTTASAYYANKTQVPMLVVNSPALLRSQTSRPPVSLATAVAAATASRLSSGRITLPQKQSGACESSTTASLSGIIKRVSPLSASSFPARKRLFQPASHLCSSLLSTQQKHADSRWRYDFSPPALVTRVATPTRLLSSCRMVTQTSIAIGPLGTAPAQYCRPLYRPASADEVPIDEKRLKLEN